MPILTDAETRQLAFDASKKEILQEWLGFFQAYIQGQRRDGKDDSLSGATLGAATAAKEAGRRCLAFIGDGSACVLSDSLPISSS